MKRLLLITVASLLATSCVTYNAYQKARAAERTHNWDVAVVEYEKALEIDPDNTRFKLNLANAKREASRVHFEKGKSLRAAAQSATGADQLRLNRMAASEFEMTVKLDPTNQFAAVELDKAIRYVEEASRVSNGETIDEMKQRNRGLTKAQPPQLNPASDEPIDLNFPRETPVKEIYRALGNAFGINILFDQAVKDDRIVIELRDVTAQAALERVMQAANHFYKVLDDKTIIVVPDNPQSRRDYEDLVIRTFYLSNGDAEQVTNVVRTMIEARNVFPLKALNAITIRDTADKVRIAEKIIEANDKAKAEVVVEVELVQLDLNKVRDFGLAVSGFSNAAPGQITPIGPDGKTYTGGTISSIAGVLGSLSDLRQNLSFTIPTASYAILKSIGNSELLANPELRISEGEKATLHIGQKIPVPVSTFSSAVTGTQPGGAFFPTTSYQYQDVGIKVTMEPRVHHNREVTLKLTVEVSNQGPSVEVAGQPPQPTFATRTIESTIRLRDGETNFLAGLIQSNKEETSAKTPFLGDIPFIGRLFTRAHKGETRTDLVLTMTPHIIRIPDITEDDLAPMWVGTTNNLTFRGVSPRIESQSGVDPFTARPAAVEQFGGSPQQAPQQLPPPIRDPNQPAPPPPALAPIPGSGPSNPFNRPEPVTPPTPQASAPSGETVSLAARASDGTTDTRILGSPRIAAQPGNLAIKPGEEKFWTVMGMDLDGLTTAQLLFHYDSRSLDVSEAMVGPAVEVNPALPPIVSINRDTGTIRITSSDGKPLRFRAGGEVIMLRVRGGLSGDTFLVLENPDFRNGAGAVVAAAVSGGRARVE